MSIPFAPKLSNSPHRTTVCRSFTISYRNLGPEIEMRRVVPKVRLRVPSLYSVHTFPSGSSPFGPIPREVGGEVPCKGKDRETAK